MWKGMKRLLGWLRDRVTLKVARRIVIVLFLIVLFYYLIGMVIVENINDDKDYASDSLLQLDGGSAAVAMSTALIDREINQHSWISNDPFFKPGYMLDNMAHFQRGIFSALAIFSVELKDQLGRNRGSSQTDEDLKEFTGSIHYAPNKWYFDFSISIWPIAPAEKHYVNALNHLRAYNDRLSRGEATYERRADNLLSTLDKIALDLGSSSDSISKKIANGIGCVLDTKADDLFYEVKGRSYAYWLLLKGLRQDFHKVIADRDVGNSWDLMEDSLSALIGLDPMIVSNCDADDFLFQNHIAAQGFFLLRARTQLREITNILLK